MSILEETIVLCLTVSLSAMYTFIVNIHGWIYVSAVNAVFVG